MTRKVHGSFLKLVMNELLKEDKKLLSVTDGVVVGSKVVGH